MHNRDVKASDRRYGGRGFDSYLKTSIYDLSVHGMHFLTQVLISNT